MIIPFTSLATVVIMYMTLTQTVVPIYQKEILAEQVARAQKEKTKILAENESITRELVSKRSTLSEVNFQLKRAIADRSAATLAKESAETKLKKVKKSLDLTVGDLSSAKWTSFGMELDWIVFGLNNKYRWKAFDMEVWAPEYGLDVPQIASVQQYSKALIKARPKPEDFTNDFYKKVASLGPNDYPKYMIDQFISYMKNDVERIKCDQISEQALHKMAEETVRLSDDAAKEQVRGYKARADREILYQISPSQKAKDYATIRRRTEISALIKMQNNFAARISDCFSEWVGQSLPLFERNGAAKVSSSINRK